MTILPRKSSFMSGLAGGASEGTLYNVQNKLQQRAFQNALKGFQDYFQGGQGGISGATQDNPMAVYGEPGQNPVMGGGGSAPQPQRQNSIMQFLMRMLGGMRQGVGAGGAQAGMAGEMGPMAGMAGIAGMNPVAGTAGMAGINPMVMMLLQRLLGGQRRAQW